jgi:serine/threonine protein kinase
VYLANEVSLFLLLFFFSQPENILYSSDNVDALDPGQGLKIVDFGTANAEVSGLATPTVGTLGYKPPELITGSKHDKSVDMWALGVITYILLCGFPPFFSDSADKTDMDQLENAPFWIFFNNESPDIFEAITTANYEFPDQFWAHISAEAKDFVSKLLVVDPTNRMSAPDALKHLWLVGAPTVVVTAELEEHQQVLLSTERSSGGGDGGDDAQECAPDRVDDGDGDDNNVEIVEGAAVSDDDVGADADSAASGDDKEQEAGDNGEYSPIRRLTLSGVAPLSEAQHLLRTSRAASRRASVMGFNWAEGMGASSGSVIVPPPPRMTVSEEPSLMRDDSGERNTGNNDAKSPRLSTSLSPRSAVGSSELLDENVIQFQITPPPQPDANAPETARSANAHKNRRRHRPTDLLPTRPRSREGSATKTGDAAASSSAAAPASPGAASAIAEFESAARKRASLRHRENERLFNMARHRSAYFSRDLTSLVTQNEHKKQRPQQRRSDDDEVATRKTKKKKSATKLRESKEEAKDDDAALDVDVVADGSSADDKEASTRVADVANSPLLASEKKGTFHRLRQRHKERRQVKKEKHKDKVKVKEGKPKEKEKEKEKEKVKEKRKSGLA